MALFAAEGVSALGYLLFAEVLVCEQVVVANAFAAVLAFDNVGTQHL